MQLMRRDQVDPRRTATLHRPAGDAPVQAGDDAVDAYPARPDIRLDGVIVTVGDKQAKSRSVGSTEPAKVGKLPFRSRCHDPGMRRPEGAL